MAEMMYSLMAFVGLAVMLLMLNLALELKIRENLGSYLYMVFLTAAIFCLVDACWGLLSAGLIDGTYFLFNFISAFFHLFALICSFVWFVYTLLYLDFRSSDLSRVLFSIPLVIGILLIASNPVTDYIYIIDENLAYYSGSLRYALFLLHYVYFLSALGFAIYKYVQDKKQANPEGKHYSTIIFYLLFPAFAGVLQLKFPYAPFYSAGFMLSAVVLFSGNIYKEFSSRLRKESNYYKHTSIEISNALEALANTYVSIHLIDLTNNTQRKLHSTSYIDSYVLPEDDAATQIKKVMQNVTNRSYTKAMVEFVDLTTLPERMAGRNIISREFLGVNEGWCISSFIRVESDEKGNMAKALHAVLSINEEKKKEKLYTEKLKQALENKNTIYAEMLQAESNGIIASNSNDEILIINDSAARFFNYASAEDAPKDINELMREITLDTSADYVPMLENVKDDGTPFYYYFSVNGEDGTIKYLRGHARGITLMDGEKIIITSLTDITRNREIENELKFMSDTDALTGLNNRGSGERKISRLLEDGEKGMFCLIDIDKFKHINDTYGHKTGDIILVEIARCLKASFRESDIVMRLGGDEFAVFAKGLASPSVAEYCINELFKKLDALEIPDLQGEGVSISVGINLIPEGGGLIFDQIYQEADAVLYESKKTTGNSFTFHK